jgi:site-specific recombinase XerD
MKAFRILLTSLDLYEDLGGRSRSLYSLRHTYATNAILNGVDFETLSVQMGAGVGMLEKHYSHLKPEMRAGTLSGLDAKRRKEAKQDENE